MVCVCADHELVALPLIDTVCKSVREIVKLILIVTDYSCV